MFQTLTEAVESAGTATDGHAVAVAHADGCKVLRCIGSCSCSICLPKIFCPTDDYRTWMTLAQ